MILWTIFAVWAFMTICWIVSIYIKNVSFVDTIYSINFLLIHAVYQLLAPTQDFINYLVLFFTALWAIRLSIHIGIKNIGIGEEKRYQRFRKKYGQERYWWFSYFQVFLLQGAFLLIFASPIHISYYLKITNTHMLQPYLLTIGSALFLTGFIYESIADWQLLKFKQNSTSEQFLQAGLWQYSRHPNYFGELLLWYGLAMISISKSPSLFSTLGIIGPIFLTFVISQLSGPKNHEPYMEKEKPGYIAYQQNTPSIIPRFYKP